jgi:hypothetical protein
MFKIGKVLSLEGFVQKSPLFGAAIIADHRSIIVEYR